MGTQHSHASSSPAHCPRQYAVTADQKGPGLGRWPGWTERSGWRGSAGSGRQAAGVLHPQRSPAGCRERRSCGRLAWVEPGDPACPAPRGHLQEAELRLPQLPGVLGSRLAGGPQSQCQARPFQPQLQGRQGAPGGHLEGQCEGLPIAEPLVSQEQLWGGEKTWRSSRARLVSTHLHPFYWRVNFATRYQRVRREGPGSVHHRAGGPPTPSRMGAAPSTQGALGALTCFLFSGEPEPTLSHISSPFHFLF